VFENHVATQYQRGSGREDVRPPAKPGEPTLTDNESTASYYGPSFMIDELIYNYDDGSSVENVLINCHYPISPTSFVLQYGIIVKKAAHLAVMPPSAWPRPAPSTSAAASSRTSRSGATRPVSTTRCCARRTDRCTSCGVGTSSSTSTSRT
jgi:3-ketosteroid 9alpha-hydroxylase-like protein